MKAAPRNVMPVISDKLDAGGVASYLSTSGAWEGKHCYLPGRGWYTFEDRASGGIWRHDPEGLSIRQASRYALERMKVQQAVTKGIRAQTVSQELEALLCVRTVFDTDPETVGIPYGSLMDLRTGQSIGALPGSNISRCLGAYPLAGATPHWDAVLAHICKTPEQHEFLRLFIGSCITGHTRDHKFLFLQGPGGGGKTTLMEVIKAVAGEYHTGVPADALAGQHSQHKQWLARLDGARVTTVPEIDGTVWRCAVLKSLVSGDTQTANYMRRGSFDFQPSTKLIIGANEKPSIPRPDSGLARRMVLIEVDAIPEAMQDSHLSEKLMAELPQITRWFCDAARDYLERGKLPPIPDEWKAASADYMNSEDYIGAWFDECVTITGDIGDFEPGGRLAKHCSEHSTRRVSSAAIYDWLRAKGLLADGPQGGVDNPTAYKHRRRHGGSANSLQGIAGLHLPRS